MDTVSLPSGSMPESPAPAGHRRGCRSFGGFYIAATVIAFFVFWPIGLAMLAWALWREQIKALPIVQKLRGARIPSAASMRPVMARRPSNTALAAYLEREQERLKSEQEKLNELVKAFEAFKDAERRASDQRDFDTFLQQRDGDENRT